MRDSGGRRQQIIEGTARQLATAKFSNLAAGFSTQGKYDPKPTLIGCIASTHKTLPRQRNGDNSWEFLGNADKNWKTPAAAQPPLIYFRRMIYGYVDRLVCNQEVGGSIPLVST